ncbi:MAG: ParB/RepB/Spo0J family partition protein [Solirubrobacterales bacterium]|nr:ParB/RepB/Spo0J family partition protein [Solirubrobacterales bacterium]
MAERTRGMGRGLAAILTPTTISVNGNGGTDQSDLRDVPVELIRANPDQPRQHFDETALVALADSLHDRGVLQPILVRPLPGGTYEIVAGERRWRAALLAGLESVPALVRPHDNAESIELALVENMAREDLNPVEEARACALLVDELGLSREALGRRIGRSRAAVSNLMRLLDLPDEALDLMATRRLSEGHGRAVLMAPGHDERRRLARTAAEEGWSVRQTETAARVIVESFDGEAQDPRSGRTRIHADQHEAVARLADAFGRVLDANVKVSPSGDGYRVALTFDSLDDALMLVERLDPDCQA